MSSALQDPVWVVGWCVVLLLILAGSCGKLRCACVRTRRLFRTCASHAARLQLSKAAPTYALATPDEAREPGQSCRVLMPVTPVSVGWLQPAPPSPMYDTDDQRSGAPAFLGRHWRTGTHEACAVISGDTAVIELQSTHT